MTCRFPVLSVPGVLEDYLQQFDRSVVSREQRRVLRDYVIALLLPLRLPAGADEGFGTGQGGQCLVAVARLQWFLSESPWGPWGADGPQGCRFAARPGRRGASHITGAWARWGSAARR
jgi:hypothetical protein